MKMVYDSSDKMRIILCIATMFLSISAFPAEKTKPKKNKDTIKLAQAECEKKSKDCVDYCYREYRLADKEHPLAGRHVVASGDESKTVASYDECIEVCPTCSPSTDEVSK